MSVQSSSFSAEYGRNSGANINVVTKSGAARFHGSAFETFRNNALDANAYFAAVKPELRFNDFGWSFGGPIAVGPIKKGKLFFFEGEEWKKIRKTTNATRQTLPTLAEMGGNFSDRTTTVYYPGTKNPIPGNIVPANLITPDGQAVMNVYKAMSKLAALYINSPIGNNATYQVANPFNYREDILRLDWHPTERHSVYFRYIHDAYNIIDPFSTFAGISPPDRPHAAQPAGLGPSTRMDRHHQPFSRQRGPRQHRLQRPENYDVRGHLAAQSVRLPVPLDLWRGRRISHRHPQRRR